MWTTSSIFVKQTRTRTLTRTLTRILTRALILINGLDG